jgi:hypothetical protein
MTDLQDFKTEKRQLDIDLDFTSPNGMMSKSVSPLSLLYFLTWPKLDITIGSGDNTEKTGKIMLNKRGPPKQVGLSNLNIIAYAAGHIYNDM